MSHKTQYIAVSYMYTDAEFNLKKADAELNYEVDSVGRVALQGIRDSLVKKLDDVKEEDIVITSITFLPRNVPFKYKAIDKFLEGTLFGLGVSAAICIVSVIIGVVK